MKNDPDKLLRYTPFERANHWLAALTFILLALSGLAFFHPSSVSCAPCPLTTSTMRSISCSTDFLICSSSG